VYRREAERPDRLHPAERAQLELIRGQEDCQHEERPAGAVSAAEFRRQLEEAQARQQAKRELVSIEKIERRAKPSTKEAVGERPITPGEVVQPRRERPIGARLEGATRLDLDREGRGASRWSTSPSLDGRAPERAREAGARAADGRVPHRQPRRAERAPQSFPCHDLVESMGRPHIEYMDTPKALANYEVAGKIEYTADPMARAIARLEADHEAVLVLNPSQWECARAELARRPELAADVEKRSRLVDADAAYAERQRRREEWVQRQTTPARRARVEPGTIPRAYVVADEPWASMALTRAASVAAESHLVTSPPRPIIAEQTAAEVERIREGLARHDAQRAEERDHQAQEHVRQRSLQAEHQAGRPAERAGAERGGVERGT
jgi:hypothetical protein